MSAPKQSSSIFHHAMDSRKSTVTFGFCKMLLITIAIINIIIGSVYFRSCPAEYLIPYHLIISGVASILSVFLSSLPCRDHKDPNKMPTPLLAVLGIVLLFKLAFFIAGAVWIYSIYAPNYINPADQKYCDRVLYLYAFWMTTMSFVSYGLLLLVFFCIQCLCCGLFAKPT